MRDIEDVLKEKQSQLEAVRRQVEALRTVAPLLAEEADGLKKPAQSQEINWKNASAGLPVKAWP